MNKVFYGIRGKQMQANHRDGLFSRTKILNYNSLPLFSSQNGLAVSECD